MFNLAEMSSKKYNVHVCSTVEDAILCSENCEFKPEQYEKFLVSKNSDSVSKFYYKNNELITNINIRDCHIYDDENWVCGKGSSKKHRMREGIYSNGFTCAKSKTH